MSLSTDPAFSILKNQFVCGVRDISGEPWAGRSGSHAMNGQAFVAHNGAGAHNLQLFVLEPDGTVLHCLPGYWSSEDLVAELGLAQQLHHIYHDNRYSRAQKDQLFAMLQRSHIQQHDASMGKRSQMEHFDKNFEARKRGETSDTMERHVYYVDSKGKVDPSAFKTTDVIMHERMALRPFVKYQSFDVAAFSDYGQMRYDKGEDRRPPSRP